MPLSRTLNVMCYCIYVLIGRESILPNFFVIKTKIFSIKLGRFIVKALSSYVINAQA
jgi:hypothetical protein